MRGRKALYVRKIVERGIERITFIAFTFTFLFSFFYLLSYMVDVEEKVYDIIVDKLAVPRGTLTLESDLAKDLGADSLDMVELIMEFERVFNIKIADDDVEKTRTIGQVVDYIKTHLPNNDDEAEGCSCCDGNCSGCSTTE